MIFPPSFKIILGTIVFLWPCLAHSSRCNFTNNIDRREPFGYIRRPSVYGNGGAEGLEFIWYVDGREPQINKVWSFGDNDVTHEFHRQLKYMLALESSESSCLITLLKVGVESLFLEEFPLMEVWNGWPLLPYTEPVEPFGMIISWLPVVVGETGVPPQIMTGEVNLGDLMEVLTSSKIVLSVSVRFTSAEFWQTRAPLRAASVTITF